MPEVGPVGRRALVNLRELLEARGLSFRRASARMDELGRPLPPLGFSRIIKGERRIDLDELVALSLLLGVNPDALLFPRHVPTDDMVELTPKVQQRVGPVWAWADGRGPLPDGMLAPGTETFEISPEAFADFARHARPLLGYVRGLDAVQREAANLAARLESLHSDFGAPQTWQARRDGLMRTYQMLGLMLEELTAIGDEQARKAGPSAPAVDPLYPFGQRP